MIISAEYKGRVILINKKEIKNVSVRYYESSAMVQYFLCDIIEDVWQSYLQLLECWRRLPLPHCNERISVRPSELHCLWIHTSAETRKNDFALEIVWIN